MKKIMSTVKTRVLPAAVSVLKTCLSVILVLLMGAIVLAYHTGKGAASGFRDGIRSLKNGALRPKTIPVEADAE